jgi:hypothetical protein
MDDKTFIDRAMKRFMEDPAAAIRNANSTAERREIDRLRAINARLHDALTEIARPKRGGIEANDSDEEWVEYLRKALEREQSTARAALAEGK